GRRLARKDAPPASPLTPEQRLLALDAWRRSGLPAGDFAPLVGVSKHTLYAWKHKFEAEGPAGLEDRPRGAPSGSRLPEPTRRAPTPLHQDEGGPPRWGLRAHQRPPPPGPRPARQPLRRRTGPARGRLRDPGGPNPAPPRQGPTLRARQAQPALADRPVHLRV